MCNMVVIKLAFMQTVSTGDARCLVVTYFNSIRRCGGDWSNDCSQGSDLVAEPHSITTSYFIVKGTIQQ